MNMKNIVIETHEHEWMYFSAPDVYACTYVYLDGKVCMAARSAELPLPFGDVGTRTYPREAVKR